MKVCKEIRVSSISYCLANFSCTLEAVTPKTPLTKAIKMHTLDKVIDFMKLFA